MELKQKILVIDDTSSILKFLEMYLKKIGFTQILTATDGMAGWQTLEQAHSEGIPVDFILSDWNMPEMMGIDLLKKVREDNRFSAVPFIMITSEKKEASKKQAEDLGVSGYISKPFNEQKLKKVISEACKIEFI